MAAMEQLLQSWRRLLDYCGDGKAVSYSGAPSHPPISSLLERCTSGDLPFAARLARKILLTRFQLLWVSTELEGGAAQLCKAVLEEVEAVNSQVEASCRLHDADLLGSAIAVRAARVARRLQSELSFVMVRDAAAQEAALMRALVECMTVCTSLLPAQDQRNHGWQEATERRALTELWRSVSLHMTHSIINFSQKYSNKLSRTVKEWGSCQEIQHHTAVLSCLRNVSLLLDQQQTMAQWDQGFQRLLSAQSVDTCKGFAANQSAADSTLLLLSQVLPPLTSYCCTLSQSPVSAPPTTHSQSPVSAPPTTHSLMAQHMNTLHLSLPVSSALLFTTRATGNVLRQGLAGRLASGKLRAVVQLVLVDGPALTAALEDAVSQVSPPLLGFPPSSPLHMSEGTSRHYYGLLYTARQLMKDTVECAGRDFLCQWRSQCSGLLERTFPSKKQWRALGRKSFSGTPSNYTSLIEEQLLSPLVRTACSLPVQPQQALLAVTMSALVCELRRKITALTSTFGPSAAQQLSMDFHHLKQRLSSTGHLHSVTVAMLSSLPAVVELEQGLQVLSGCEPSRLEVAPWPCSENMTRELVTELAWCHSLDWNKCVFSFTNHGIQK